MALIRFSIRYDKQNRNEVRAGEYTLRLTNHLSQRQGKVQHPL